MTQALPKIVTFDEFIAWYPENSGVRYELHNGEIVEMVQPTGKHERIKGFSAAELTLEFRRLDLRYFIPNQAIVKPYQLIDGEYQVTQFRGSDKIISPTFPELKLTAEQVFNAGR